MLFEIWIIICSCLLISGAILKTPWLVITSTSVMVILISANILKKLSLNGIKYSRTFLYSRGFPGEKLDIKIQIENEKKLPVPWIQAIDNWPTTISPIQKDTFFPSHLKNYGFLTNTFSLQSQQKKIRSFQLALEKRGVYRVGPVNLESSDIFGLYPSKTTFEIYDYVTVYPKINPLQNYGLQTEDPFGLEKTNRRIFEDPMQTIGIRNYHPEDELRKIHWNATARTGQLQVKMYQPVSEKVVVVFLNISSSQRSWEGTNYQQLEHLINLSASTIYKIFNQGYAVGLLSNGSQSYSDQPSRIMPGKSRKQLPALLQALSGITQFTSAPFESFILSNATRIPYGSTIIVITSLITSELIEVFSRLRKFRFNTTVIFTGMDIPPHIESVRIFRIPLVSESVS
jgi:uncharacterized protein (DUF58 family)